MLVEKDRLNSPKELAIRRKEDRLTLFVAVFVVPLLSLRKPSEKISTGGKCSLEFRWASAVRLSIEFLLGNNPYNPTRLANVTLQLCPASPESSYSCS